VIPRWLEAQRPFCWQVGVQHREALVARYMARKRLAERPLLKEIVDELIEEIQGARLREGMLPLDRFAQTEVVNGRAEITINKRIAKMPGVKEPGRVANVAKWHESMHVALDVKGPPRRQGRPATLPLGLQVEGPQPTLCRTAIWTGHEVSPREFIAEAAGLAAAIADADLQRCVSYVNFLQHASTGGNLGPVGWRLLYSVSAVIGVNITALVRYLEQHELCRLVARGDQTRLLGVRRPFRGFECLQATPGRNRLVA
jgi:hypothetical protein